MSTLDWTARKDEPTLAKVLDAHRGTSGPYDTLRVTREQLDTIYRQLAEGQELGKPKWRDVPGVRFESMQIEVA